jgi:membrane associated rhomboid family serine protease
MSEVTPGSASGAVPHCYRHPQRETYISCTRCERPICPDCMTSASVGFQCPDCVAEGASSVQHPRTAMTGSADDRPVVTFTLIGLCVAVYLLQSASVLPDAVERFSMWPAGIAFGDEYYRLLTAAFLHGSLLHIGFNMLVLWTLGPTLERILGHLRFVVLYLLAALGGSVASYLFSNPLTPSVGASGAIFGLMGALVVAGRRLGFDITQVLVLIGINVLIGFVPGGNIDWRAHLGGLVTGAVVAAVMVHAPVRGPVAFQVAGCLAVLVLLVGLTLWRTSTLRVQFTTSADTGSTAAAGLCPQTCPHPGDRIPPV